MPRIHANQADFYYEIHGNGQPIILISGYVCDHFVWFPILENLSKHFQVIIFDNRGVGQTKDLNVPLSVELMADDVIQLTDALELNRPHLIGQSMGGTIVQTAAAKYPDKVGKLGILTSSAKWRPAMLLGLKSLLEMRENNLDLDFILDATLPWIAGTAFLKQKENIAAFKQVILENPYPQSLADQKRQYKVLEQFDGILYLKNIKAETLVAYGKEDLLSLPDESHYLAKNIQAAELVEFNCGHTIMQEVSKLLADKLIQFLNK